MSLMFTVETKYNDVYTYHGFSWLFIIDAEHAVFNILGLLLWDAMCLKWRIINAHQSIKCSSSINRSTQLYAIDG